MSQYFTTNTDSRKVQVSLQFYGLATDSYVTRIQPVGDPILDCRDLIYSISMVTERAKILPGICAAGRIEIKIPMPSDPSFVLIGRWVGVRARAYDKNNPSATALWRPVCAALIVDLEYVDGAGWIKLIGCDEGGLADKENFIPTRTRYYMMDLLTALDISYYGLYNSNSGTIDISAENNRYQSDLLTGVTIDADQIRGYTKREVAGFCASFFGGYAMDRSAIRYEGIGDTVMAAWGLNIRKWSTAPISVARDAVFLNKLTVESENALTSTATPYIDTDTDSAGDYTSPLITADLYSKVAGYSDPITYTPGEIKLRGDQRITIGDVLLVPLDSGATVQMLACEMEMRYDGGMTTTVRCYGSEPLEAIKQDARAASLRRLRSAMAAREV